MMIKKGRDGTKMKIIQEVKEYLMHNNQKIYSSDISRNEISANV